MGVDRDAVFGSISDFAEYSMWRRGTPGMVLGVTDRERTLFSSAKGMSDVTGRQSMSIDMLFQIGSVSKSFTCIAALQLSEQGVLDIHAPVKKYLPWFAIRSKYSDITLHHLMTHTAGIILGSDATPTTWTEVWDLRDTETGVEPGTYFHYSNSGYKALGLALETVAGKGYEKMVREGIFESAGMRSTEAVITNGIRGRLAVAHLPMHDDRPFRRGSELYPATWFESDTADGSICAPVEDMLAYIRVLLSRGEGPWGRVMSTDSFRLMTTPYITPDDGEHTGGYGYGLNIEIVDGHTYLGHQGGMVGYYTSMLMDLDSGIGVMVMVNGPGEPEEVARYAMEALRRMSEGAPMPGLPSKDDVGQIPDASDYAGTYVGRHGRVELVSRQDGLRLVTEGLESPLERRERDVFFADGHGLGLFVLEFGRKDGAVDRLNYGERSFVKGSSPKTDNPRTGVLPIRYEGHYRSHNPWSSNFRVVSRDGGLAFVHPHGTSEPMIPLGGNEFRIGADARSPERIIFEGVINGVATSARVSGGGRFGRTFTP